MKRTWLGATLLAVFLLLGIFSGIWMEKTHNRLSLALDDACQLAVEKRLTEASVLSRDAYTQWLRHRGATASLADHTPMEEIDRLFQELEVYIQMDEPVHYAATCAQLCTLLASMGDAHNINWWTLL